MRVRVFVRYWYNFHFTAKQCGCILNRQRAFSCAVVIYIRASSWSWSSSAVAIVSVKRQQYRRVVNIRAYTRIRCVLELVCKTSFLRNFCTSDSVVVWLLLLLFHFVRYCRCGAHYNRRHRLRHRHRQRSLHHYCLVVAQYLIFIAFSINFYSTFCVCMCVRLSMWETECVRLLECETECVWAFCIIIKSHRLRVHDTVTFA